MFSPVQRRPPKSTPAVKRLDDAAPRAGLQPDKRRLALTLSHDRKAYTDAKAPFIRGVLDRLATEA